MKSIFEAVDCTDEEMYFTVGLWATLEGAIVDIEDCKELYNVTDQDHDEYCKVEIREREMGFSDVGNKRAVIEWEYVCNNDDEYYWKRKPTEIVGELKAKG